MTQTKITLAVIASVSLSLTKYYQVATGLFIVHNALCQVDYIPHSNYICIQE